MSDRDTEQGTQGRAVRISAFGKDMPSLEMAALDGAREFFGPEMRLEVIPDYEASHIGSAPPEKRFWAMVGVREVTQ